MHAPSLDELTALLATSPVDLVAITESWLRSDIDDSLLSISAFNLFRKDRVAGRGGGICVYLNNVIPCKRRLDLEKFGFINGVDNVNWPPYRDSKS